MRASRLKDTLKQLYTIKRTTCIEGAPGGGKTTIVQEVAKELGVKYIERHMPTMLVEDFGIPMPSGDKLVYKLPEWFPTDPDSQGILCFDDRNQASADLQKVLANICQARNLHGVPLPDGWMVVSTGNRTTDRAGANRVLSHLRNRETVVSLETELEDWTTWALDNDVREEVIGFIRFRPDLLHQFKPEQESNPTPRSWVEGVSAVLDVVPKDCEAECFSGAVGQGASSEFTGFLRIFRELPDPDLVIKNPKTSVVPDKVNVQYAMVGAIAKRANRQNFGNVVEYLSRMPGEFSVLCVNMALRRDRDLHKTPAFTDWAIANEKLISKVNIK